MKRGQMKLSFGMIFSIILIIIFIAFAFYVVKNFLGLQETVKLAQFKAKLQDDVDKMWKGAKGSQPVSYVLPQKIKAVCFEHDDYENLKFSADEFVEGAEIDHIEFEEGLCLDVKDGRVKMILKKDYGDASVTIENEE
jgi:hypothetical protein